MKKVIPAIGLGYVWWQMINALASERPNGLLFWAFLTGLTLMFGYLTLSRKRPLILRLTEASMLAVVAIPVIWFFQRINGHVGLSWAAYEVLFAFVIGLLLAREPRYDGTGEVMGAIFGVTTWIILRLGLHAEFWITWTMVDIVSSLIYTLTQSIRFRRAQTDEGDRSMKP